MMCVGFRFCRFVTEGRRGRFAHALLFFGSIVFAFLVLRWCAPLGSSFFFFCKMCKDPGNEVSLVVLANACSGSQQDDPQMLSCYPNGRRRSEFFLNDEIGAERSARTPDDIN